MSVDIMLVKNLDTNNVFHIVCPNTMVVHASINFDSHVVSYTESEQRLICQEVMSALYFSDAVQSIMATKLDLIRNPH